MMSTDEDNDQQAKKHLFVMMIEITLLYSPFSLYIRMCTCQKRRRRRHQYDYIVTYVCLRIERIMWLQLNRSNMADEHILALAFMRMLRET